MRKIILFRISSKGYPKVKVNGVNKYDALKNLTSAFKGWEFICVADNCDDALLAHLKQKNHFDQFIETQQVFNAPHVEPCLCRLNSLWVESRHFGFLSYLHVTFVDRHIQRF